MRQRPNMFNNTLSNLNDEVDNANHNLSPSTNIATTMNDATNNSAKQSPVYQQSQSPQQPYLTTTSSNQSNSDGVASSAIASSNIMILKNKSSKSTLFK
jgi:hypothetical protein